MFENELVLNVHSFHRNLFLSREADTVLLGYRKENILEYNFFLCFNPVRIQSISGFL